MVNRRAKTPSLSFKTFIIAITSCFFILGLTSCAHVNKTLTNSTPDSEAASNKSIEIEYKDRVNRLYIPKSQRNNLEKIPLLIVLHGGLGNAEFIENGLGMNEIADKYGFMVAYLNGTDGRWADHRTWNAGNSCCGVAAQKQTDDVGYIDSFIKFMLEKYPVNAKQLFLTGHSNGAMMSYRFICERPGVIVAMVAISGPRMANQCLPNKTQILHIHGEIDQHVPIVGGSGKKSMTKNIEFTSVAQTRKMVEQAGASFTLKLVPNAEHPMKEINQALKDSGSASLAEIIGKFLVNTGKQQH